MLACLLGFNVWRSASPLAAFSQSLLTVGVDISVRLGVRNGLGAKPLRGAYVPVSFSPGTAYTTPRRASRRLQGCLVAAPTYVFEGCGRHHPAIFRADLMVLRGAQRYLFRCGSQLSCMLIARGRRIGDQTASDARNTRFSAQLVRRFKPARRFQAARRLVASDILCL